MTRLDCRQSLIYELYYRATLISQIKVSARVLYGPFILALLTPSHDPISTPLEIHIIALPSISQ